MTTPGDSWPRWLTSPLSAAVVLLCFYAAVLASLRDKSATSDEPGHAVSGIAYWKYADYRLDPENGNLTQRLIALPLVFGDTHFPSRSSPAWREANVFGMADTWLNRLGNDSAAMLARGRAGSAWFAVALGALVWCWSRRLFGPVGGMFSLLLYVLNPTILANGGLMTSDTAGALFLLLSLACVTAMLQKLSPLRVLVSGFAMGALFVAKMSAVLIVPVAVALVGWRIFDGQPLALGASGSRATRAGKAIALAMATLCHVGLIFLVIWGVYGFRYRAFSTPEVEAARFDRPWEWAFDQPDHAVLLNALGLSGAQAPQAMEVFKAHGVSSIGWSHASLAALQDVRRTVLTAPQVHQLDAMMKAPPPAFIARVASFARATRLLPEAYLYGCAHVWRLARSRAAFFNGEVGDTGWRMFFPYTFSVKTPLAFLGIAVLAVVAGRARAKSGPRDPAADGARIQPSDPTLPLWLFMGVYWLAAIMSHINIGHRHLLPVYPPLFVLCGAAAGWLAPGAADAQPRETRRRFFAGALGLGLAALVVETACWFPNYLAYFNGLVRPSLAYRHLIDSSLDWGQDLPAARRYLDARRETSPVFLAYFGMGSPLAHGITATQIYGFFGHEKATSPALRVLSGLSAEQDRARIDEFLRREPAYDPALVGTVSFGAHSAALLVKKASAFRLTSGTYLISASLVQPVVYTKAFGPWTAARESAYQRLREIVRPLLADETSVRAAALEKLSARDWLAAFDDYDEYRFARLTAFLRQREPDDHINYSILVYHLSDADVARALDGAPPY